MKSYIFPGQGAQFTGMGKGLYERSEAAKSLFDAATEVLGFDLKSIMFHGDDEKLKQTNITQPAIFVHSVAAARSIHDFKPDMVAGHSLGEFSALVASNVLAFEDGLLLVSKRANAMQKACEVTPSTMAAVLGLEDVIVENICKGTEGIVVAANYNCPGQLVISGEEKSVDVAVEKLKEAGARRALKLPVRGAFHSPLMEPAQSELEKAINEVAFNAPICPIYQNTDGKGQTDVAKIKENLIKQLTSPVRWTQTIQNMIKDGARSFIECGPGNVLQGLVKKVDRSMSVSSVS